MNFLLEEDEFLLFESETFKTFVSIPIKREI